MNKTKKYVTIAAVLLCVCAAVYLNWSYNNKTAKSASADAAAADAAESKNTSGTDSASAGATDKTGKVSDYFASARLTRQQSRDEALSLLEAAAATKSASQETIDSATNSIAAMANYSMQETEIENILLAKNFAECVAFVTKDGVTLAVPSPESGLKAEDVAKIADAVTSETDFTATQIKIIEVKNSATGQTVAETSGDGKAIKNDSNPFGAATANAPATDNTKNSSSKTSDSAKDSSTKTNDSTNKSGSKTDSSTGSGTSAEEKAAESADMAE